MNLGLNEFKKMVQFAPDSILVVDSQGLIQYANQYVQSYLGYEPEELIGQPIECLMPEAYRKDHVAYREHYKKHLTTRPMGSGRKLYALHKNGHTLDVDINLSPLKTDVGELFIVAVMRDISMHRMLENELHYLAQHDSNTGLGNSRYLHDKLPYLINLARRHQWILVVCYIDLDNFKWVNDTFGHAIGDRLLKTIAMRLTEATREVDVVSRVGGDEFVCVFTGLKIKKEVMAAIKKLQELLFEPLKIEEEEIPVSASIGISCFPNDSDYTKDLISKADTAMYQAKKHGKGFYCFYSDIEKNITSE